MKILVTGGAGFIGSHLCDKLIFQEENEIIVLDNLSVTNSRKNIEHLIGNKKFEFINLNIAINIDKLEQIFDKNKIDVVFHFASNSDISQSNKNPNIDLENTFLTTYNILNCMKKYKVNKIVFPSTSAIYGNINEPLHENKGPLFPVSHYGAGKLSSEAFISSFCENYNFKAWIIRFPNVVGERTTHGIIFDFIRKLIDNNDVLEVLGDGEQNKPYVYVKDLIEAIIYIYENSNDKINFFNVGVNSSTKVKDIARILLEELDIKRKIVFKGGNIGWIGDVPQFNYNIDKINKLGWKAKYTSDDAIRMTIKLEKENIKKKLNKNN